MFIIACSKCMYLPVSMSLYIYIIINPTPRLSFPRTRPGGKRYLAITYIEYIYLKISEEQWAGGVAYYMLCTYIYVFTKYHSTDPVFFSTPSCLVR